MQEKTYRDIFKWGELSKEINLDAHVLDFLTKTYQGVNTNEKYLPGNTEVSLIQKSKLPKSIVEQISSIVGKDNFSDSDIDRAKHSIGRFFLDSLKGRLGQIDFPVDAVVYPKTEDEVLRILQICKKEKIAIIPAGARSSVTRALEAPKGGISIDLTKHFKQVLKLSQLNASVTAQAGIYGPELEAFLNEKGYTCGHFPQSFEFSTLGGWIAARGAGQASTGYGKMENMLLSLRVVTTEGILETKDYPAASIGPDIDQIILGSEGILGVITQATMKVRKYNPDNSSMTSFMFPDFESGVNAMREIMQGGFGVPHFFRLQDPEETQLSFLMSGLEGTFKDKFLQWIGFKPFQRSLMHIIVDGDKDYSQFVLNKTKKIAKKNKAFQTGKSPVWKWLEQRYSSAYLREPFMDLGFVIDTIETSVNWENLLGLWKEVRAYIKTRPETFCLVHISHAYENGANLYFIFLGQMKKNDEVNEFETFHKGIIEAIHNNNGSLSHHHGVGRLTSAWLEGEIGELGVKVYKGIKNTLDPSGIMNPGCVIQE